MPPQSYRPPSPFDKVWKKSLFLSALMPKHSANSANSPTHAFRSDVQLLQCTIATGSPAGVVTISISRCIAESGFSEQSSQTRSSLRTIAGALSTLFVAVIPVPGVSLRRTQGNPRLQTPERSRSLAPSFVSVPAISPARSTFGNISRSFQGNPLSARAHQISVSFLHHNRQLQSRWGTSRMPLRFRQRAVRSASSGCNRRGVLK